jgi:hypothetical protein
VKSVVDAIQFIRQVDPGGVAPPIAKTDLDRVIELAKTLGTPVLLPLGLVWLGHRFALRQSKHSHESTIRQAVDKEKRERAVADDDALLDRHRKVIATLYQLLTDVQLRHVRAQCSELSDDECVGIDNDGLQERIQDAQNQLSQEYIFIGSAMINRVYDFVRTLTELMVVLQRIKTQNRPNKRQLETTAIFEAAERAADILTALQARVTELHAERFKSGFKPDEVPLVRNCCGVPPTAEQREELRRFEQDQDEKRAEFSITAATAAVLAAPKTH